MRSFDDAISEQNYKLYCLGYLAKMQEIQSKKPRLDSLDTLRGIAALSIVFFHMVGINHLAVNGSFDVIGKYFGLAVPLFFVVSAFSLYIGYWGKLHNIQHIKRYLYRRFLRIAPLFYFMIVVYAILIVFYFHAHLDISEIFIDLSFLFGLFPGKHETIVWAGWSIGVEFLFYFLLPLLMIFSKNFKNSFFLLLFFLVIGTYAFTIFSNHKLPLNYQYENLLTHMPFFMFGIVSYFCYVWLNQVSKKKIIALVIFILSIILIPLIINDNAKISIFDQNFIDLKKYIWGIVFSLWIVALSINPINWIVNRFTIWVGRMSFSIYLWHPLIVYIINPIHQKIYNFGLHNNISFILSALVVFSVLFPLAHYSYKYIEKPFMNMERSK